MKPRAHQPAARVAAIADGQAATIARNLTRAHRASGLTLEAAARAAGVGKPTVWRAQRGDNLMVDNMVLLAAVYGLTLADLLAMPPCRCAGDTLTPGWRVCPECGGANPSPATRSGQ